jgi:hypothetical protein
VVAPASPRPRGIRVVTAHVTEVEFISAFHELCDETTIFAPTEKMKPIGADCAFSLELADGTPMMRGLGRIRNAWPTTDSPFGRPGIHIEIGQLTDSSKPIHVKLQTAHKLASKTRTRPSPSTHQLWGPPSGPPTEEMLSTPDFENDSVVELPAKITREIRGVTPADLEDAQTKEAPKYPDKAAPTPVGREGTVPVAVVPAPVPQPRPPIAPAVTVPPPVGAAQTSAVESTFELDSAIAAARTRPWWMNARVSGVFAAGLAFGLLISLAFRSGGDTKQVVAAASPPPPAAAQVAAVQPPPNCPPPAAAPAALAVAEEAPAKPVATKATPTRVAVAAAPKAAKPAVASAPAKPATVATTTKASTAPKPAAAKVAKVAPKREAAKVPCSSLDCI